MSAERKVIAALTRYSRRAGSSRLRYHSHFARLEEEGFDLRAQTLLPDQHLDSIYGMSSKPSRKSYLQAYIRRLRFLNSLPRGAVLWVEKELFPWAPTLVERIAMSRARATVLDLDDAWFAHYESAQGKLSPLLRNKMIDLFTAVDVITVANEFLAEEVRRRGGRDVRVVGQGIDVDRYRPLDVPLPSRPVTIGWIGTPLNAAAYLPPVVETLNRLVAETGCRILLVGAGSAVPGLIAERRRWTEETEVVDVQEFDIGIMPLSDTTWNRCKSGYKLVQSMACGQVAVGSAVGFNNLLIEHGVDGMLINPNRSHQWYETLRLLIDDPGLRHRLGASARKKITSQYSLNRVTGDFIEVFRSL